MQTLQRMFPGLTTFSDLDWPTVTAEYQSAYMNLTFPEYLQQKANDGNCPPHLFELAYYEQAVFEIHHADAVFPFESGIYINPTAIFLNLEYDIPAMLEEAEQGRIEIVERPHVLCLFRDKNDELHSIEMDNSALILLQNLEDGPQKDRTFLNMADMEMFLDFLNLQLVIEL